LVEGVGMIRSDKSELGGKARELGQKGKAEVLSRNE